MFKREEFEAHADINTHEIETQSLIEQALEAYHYQRLNLRFAGDRGVEHLSEEPTKAEAQIKSLLNQGYELRQDAQEGFYLSRGLLGGMMADRRLTALKEKLDRKPASQRSVFITYQWAQQGIARTLEQAFTAKGYLVIRDEGYLEHGVYLPGFMHIIAHENLDYVLPVISESYLKSKNCMYEVNQIMNRDRSESSFLERRLLPYVVSVSDPSADSKIYSAGVGPYLDYWKQEYERERDPEGREVIDNIQRNISPFIKAIVTRINISEKELVATQYQAFFKMIEEQEPSNFKEIEELLRVASISEKKLRHDKVKESFGTALKKLDALEHVSSIDRITGQVYGLYGEYLVRQKSPEGEQHLAIAANFGYVVSVDTQALNKADEQRQAKLKAEEACLKELEESRKLEESRLKKAKEDRKVEEQRQAKLKADEVRKAEAASKKSEAGPSSNVLLFKGPNPNTQELSQFLRLVAEGEQEQAEAMLQKNRDLVLCAGNVMDLSKRSFENITGFQYAVWALDWHMWTMLKRYLPDDQAAVQLMTTGSWVSTHGLHAGMPGGPLDKLSTALKTYLDNYDAWYKKNKDYQTIEQHWQKEVGGAQLLLPAHVINEYCRPDRPFYPCPAFEEPMLPRTRKISEGEWFTATYNDGKLGENFGVYRGGWRAPRVIELASGGVYDVLGDQKAVFSLAKVRTQQRDQLASELCSDRQHTAQRRLGT